jgi:hypothetical protein
MISTFIYIFLTWFVLGFIAAWLFGYSGRTSFQVGLAGIIAGLVILASILTFSPRMSRVFWENLREDEEATFWFGVYFATPILLLVIMVIVWLIIQILAVISRSL